MAFFYLAGDKVNHIEQAETITVSSEDTLFPKENLFDQLPSKVFKFNTAAADDKATADLNILFNGGYETWSLTNVPDSWTDESGGSSTLSEETTIKSEGTSALKLNAASGSIAKAQQDITVLSGQAMSITVDVRGDGGTNAVIIRIQDRETAKYLDNAGAWQTSATDFVNRNTASFATTTTTFTVETYATTLRHQVTLRCTAELSGAGGAQVGYVDAFYVWPHSDFASVHGHNLGSNIDLELRSSINNFTGDDTDRGSFTTTRPAMYLSLGSVITDRYWRLNFSGTNFDPISIGEWILGVKQTLARTQRWGETTKFIQPQIRSTSLAGQLFVKSLTDFERREWDADFLSITVAQRDEIQQQLVIRSQFGQFPVVIVPDSTDDVVIHGHLMADSEYSRERGVTTRWPTDLKVIESAYSISVP